MPGTGLLWRASAGVLLALGLAFAPVAVAAQETTPPSPAGPPLPFPDNPDPALCGIPRAVGDGVDAILDGHDEGELLEPRAHLYDSHLRRAVVATLASGSRVEVVLYQENPTLDFYFVRGEGPNGPVEGWAPAPFVRLLDGTAP